MPPVVISHLSVVLLHSQYPPVENLGGGGGGGGGGACDYHVIDHVSATTGPHDMSNIGLICEDSLGTSVT